MDNFQIVDTIAPPGTDQRRALLLHLLHREVQENAEVETNDGGSLIRVRVFGLWVKDFILSKWTKQQLWEHIIYHAAALLEKQKREASDV